MTDRDDHTAPEGDEMLAAEYVLGTLLLAERLAAERRARDDAGFAALIAAWEARLAPLNDDYEEMPAPNLLPAIEARLFGIAPVHRPFRQRWTSLLGGAGAAALILVGVFLVSNTHAPQGPQLVATLAAQGQPLVFTARYDEATQTLHLTRTSGPAPAAGHDYQLWTIGKDGVPVPQTLASATEVSQKLPLAPGTTLAISLEPSGGSPNGKPTLGLVSGIVKTL